MLLSKKTGAFPVYHIISSTLAEKDEKIFYLTSRFFLIKKIGNTNIVPG